MRMVDSANSALQKSLDELTRKRNAAQKVVDEYNSAIIAIEAIVNSTSETPRPVSAPKVKRKKSSIGRRKVITENMVRDAIIDLVKNPPENKQYTGKGSFSNYKDGYFGVIHLLERLDMKYISVNVRKYLNKFVERGILETAPYKSGKQYRYIRPDSPGDEFLNQPKVHDTSIGTPIRGSVAGVNNKSIRSTNKNLNRIIKLASEQKCTVERNGSGHIKISNKNGYVTVSNTPSDINAENVVRRELSKIGVNV